MRNQTKLIRLTIIRDGQKDVVEHPEASDLMWQKVDGLKADSIRLELDYDETDIDALISFLLFTRYCFPGYKNNGGQ